MSVSIRALVALHAAALLASTAFLPFLPLAAATPFPLPMPLMATEFARSPVFGDAVGAWSKSPRSMQANTTQVLASRVLSPSFSRSANDLYGREGSDISTYHQEVLDSWTIVKQCRSMDQCVSPLTSLRDSTRGVLENIEGQPLNKGLANYNKNDPRQVALKDVINVLKALVEETFKTLVDLPVVDTLLAPILGPILYDLKCIVDDILDFLENETDAVLNGLGHDCQSSWNKFCSSGPLGLGVGCLL